MANPISASAFLPFRDKHKLSENVTDFLRRASLSWPSSSGDKRQQRCEMKNNYLVISLLPSGLFSAAISPPRATSSSSSSSSRPGGYHARSRRGRGDRREARASIRVGYWTQSAINENGVFGDASWICEIHIPLLSISPTPLVNRFYLGDTFTTQRPIRFWDRISICIYEKQNLWIICKSTRWMFMNSCLTDTHIRSAHRDRIQLL